ncbi:Ubiquitin carboxyl-terminal hydrolase [Heracleum sosnowskyi]|uniref:Ubiquitin carboxyl-terminal hydrolase n=1 Tax=Heracleum sosnowskyi TaxID=360622 RepID=A0AAD8JFX3_9APIA|nr:Ubiquitin carboxyl-terminal hydrolase [Heracleum sosnowskyi]
MSSITNNDHHHPSCPHLHIFRSTHAFRSLQQCFHITPLGRAAIQRDPHDLPLCGSCLSPHRLYACLSCASISCHLHVSSHSSDHPISVDIDRAELFCCLCTDQVYDLDFDAAVVIAQLTSGPHLSPEKNGLNVVKRRRVEYCNQWVPDLGQKEQIENESIALAETDCDNVPLGLKGLNNLGNTCFMNSVLQALLHTPPLRNYFLSDRHNRFFCQQKNVKNEGINKNSKLCLSCDLDDIFASVYSGDRSSYSPAKFLYSWWQHAANLASYEQQDAHEFFISMLDGIHEKVDKDKPKPHSQGSGDCCIAHKVFSGILRSDVMCTACGFTSTTYDPCVDISLDLEPNHGGPTKPTSAKSLGLCNGEPVSTNASQISGTSTLVGCLKRFTRPERLGPDQKFFCQQCKVRQESLKQMSIRKLPLVYCFHIKRFEHSPVRKMSRKVDRYLQFPFSLNMGPYLSSSILRSRFGNRIFSFDGDEPDPSNEISCEFELFAVITHSGKLDAGHYFTYLRLSNQWYKCDDAWITRVNENIVRSSQGYMMFYVQKTLYYKASEKTRGL